MRFSNMVAVVLLLALCAGPALAANKPHRGECRKLTRQIARYERDAKWADQRNDGLWEDASKDRARQLATRRADLCPQYRRKNPFAKAADLIASAAKAAAPYFIPGL